MLNVLIFVKKKNYTTFKRLIKLHQTAKCRIKLVNATPNHKIVIEFLCC